jgi:regulatory LuxR family protein
VRLRPLDVYNTSVTFTTDVGGLLHGGVHPRTLPGDEHVGTCRPADISEATQPRIVSFVAMKQKALGISDGTVKNHLSDILRKLEARDRTHAVLKAIGARML